MADPFCTSKSGKEATKGFVDEQVIVRGGHDIVYLGKLEDGRQEV